MRARLRAKVDLARVPPRLDFDNADFVFVVHIAHLAAAALIHFEDDMSMAVHAQSGVVFA